MSDGENVQRITRVTGKGSGTHNPPPDPDSRVDPVPSVKRIEEGFAMVLEGLGIALDTPHFEDTPGRAADALFFDLCRGLKDDPPRIKTFPSTVDEMIILREIPVLSLCAHHLLPFIGTAAVAYIPGTGRILGLSKLSRIVDHLARRPQVQEDLTSEIADILASLVVDDSRETGGVGVMIRARHLCMEMRGVNHPGLMVTSAVRGVLLRKPEARAEFLRLAEG